MDRGAWQATVHGVAKSRTEVSYYLLEGQRHRGQAELSGGHGG